MLTIRRGTVKHCGIPTITVSRADGTRAQIRVYSPLAGAPDPRPFLIVSGLANHNHKATAFMSGAGIILYRGYSPEIAWLRVCQFLGDAPLPSELWMAVQTAGGAESRQKGL